MTNLEFHPFPGLSSPHAQTIAASFWKAGSELPSESLHVSLDDGDALCCEVSTPVSWEASQTTIIMVHGLGGCHASNYMTRIGLKFYKTGYRVVRFNMRGCGTGQGLAKLPYHGGRSSDILKVVDELKQKTPNSRFVLIGFSLGGNMVLKLAGELGNNGNLLIYRTIAICPAIDLAHSCSLIALPGNRFYQSYFLKKMRTQLTNGADLQNITTISDFDDAITAPRSGFRNAAQYYEQCSSISFLAHIKHSCYLLFSEDDPFIDYRLTAGMNLHDNVKIWVSPHGGHMGFLSWTGLKHGLFWLDRLLLDWAVQ